MPQGRLNHVQAMHEIAALFGSAANPPFNFLPLILGVLPAGAIINASHVIVTSNANSTTNSILIGTTKGGAELATIDGKVTGRTDTPAPVAAMGPFAVDTPIYVTFTFTGAAPTQGGGSMWLDFLPGVG